MQKFSFKLSTFISVKKFFTISILSCTALILSPSQNMDMSDEIDLDVYAAQGSLTECIEMNEVANEIEITDSAMLRATQKVSGFMPRANENEYSSDYCAIKLV